MRLLFCLLLLEATAIPLQAQPFKLVVIGSSTAEGTGAQPQNDSSWVRRLSYYYKYTLGRLDTVYNLALGGTDNGHGLPGSYTPGAGFSLPDPQRNITRANTLGPHVIIVSYVSNRYDSYPIDSIVKHLQVIKDSANAEGRICFITTSQPRTSFNVAGRMQLKLVRDSILSHFGFYALNFYDSLVNPSDLSILAAYASPYDNIHLNNAGHALLFRQVVAKGIFDVHTVHSQRNGGWSENLTWDRGQVPGPEDSVVILPGHHLTLQQPATVKALLIRQQASFTLDGPDARLEIGTVLPNLQLRRNAKRPRAAARINTPAQRRFN